MCLTKPALGAIALAVSVGFPALALAEPPAERPAVEAAALSESDAQAAAVSAKALTPVLPSAGGESEPVFAGTSTLVLLSIAVLASVAVQRRLDDDEEFESSEQ